MDKLIKKVLTSNAGGTARFLAAFAAAAANAGDPWPQQSIIIN